MEGELLLGFSSVCVPNDCRLEDEIESVVFLNGSLGDMKACLAVWCEGLQGRD